MNLVTPTKPHLVSFDGGRKFPGQDWLSELPEGTQFYVKAIKPINNQMPSSFLCQMGEVVKIVGPIRIIRMRQGDQVAEMPVDPKGFCETFECKHTTNEEIDEEMFEHEFLREGELDRILKDKLDVDK